MTVERFVATALRVDVPDVVIAVIAIGAITATLTYPIVVRHAVEIRVKCHCTPSNKDRYDRRWVRKCNISW